MFLIADLIIAAFARISTWTGIHSPFLADPPRRSRSPFRRQPPYPPRFQTLPRSSRHRPRRLRPHSQHLRLRRPHHLRAHRLRLSLLRKPRLHLRLRPPNRAPRLRSPRSRMSHLKSQVLSRLHQVSSPALLQPRPLVLQPNRELIHFVQMY